MLACLKRVEDKGHHETAHRTKQRISQIFRYAIATGRAERDIAIDLRGALAPVVTKSHAAITDPSQVGALLRAIDGYSGQYTTACALKLAPLVFVRPNELRAAEWTEFDLDRQERRISAHRMKMKEAHIVPLARQAMKIIEELQPYTGGDRFLFPSLRTTERPGDSVLTLAHTVRTVRWFLSTANHNRQVSAEIIGGLPDRTAHVEVSEQDFAEFVAMIRPQIAGLIEMSDRWLVRRARLPRNRRRSMGYAGIQVFVFRE